MCVDTGLDCLGLVGKQVGDFDHAALRCKNHAAFDQILEFAHVTRPVVSLQCLQRALFETRNALAV